MEFLSYFLNGWNLCLVDSNGQYSGLVMGWNDSIFVSNSLCSIVGILIDGHVKFLNKSVKSLNLYGLYNDRKYFWDHIFQGSFLNLVTSSREIWGDKCRMDVLSPYFQCLFEEDGLIDVEPTTLGPTWKNGRSGSMGVAKSLDCF